MQQQALSRKPESFTRPASFGVMADNLLLTQTGEIVTPGHKSIQFWNLGRLMDMARYYKLKTLWITRESGFWKSVKTAADNSGYFPQFWNAGKWTLGKGGRKNTITGWIDGEHGSTIKIIFPGLFGEDWRFDKIGCPYELFNTIELFTEKTGVEPSFPNRCSIELLKQSRPSWFKPLTENPKEFWSEFHEHIEGEFIWLREPTKAERKMKFAHAFDKRMMFLSAMRNTFAGAESFEYFENIKLSDIGKNQVGLCEIAKPKFNNPMFSEIGELAGELFKDQTRFYTPYLQLFNGVFQGSAKIKKAWLWNDAGRIFEKFAVTLGNAIKETRSKETPEIASTNAALKSLYTNFIGWFDRGSFLESPGGWAGELYRPDWRGLIISNANCNLLRNIIEVFKFTGKMPFAIYHDCLMYFSDFENPHHEFNGTSLLDENKFSHEWTLPAIRVLKAIKLGESAGKIDGLGKEAK